MARMLLAGLMLCVLGGCGSPRGDGWMSARMYFGLSSPQGEVGAADFSAFTDAVITPAFPDGLTRYHTDGQWRGKDGTVGKERSEVVEILYPADRDREPELRRIMAAYKARFHQESVMLVLGPARVEFE
jgi:hypothetical protein